MFRGLRQNLIHDVNRPGLDVTEISRITYMLERYGARFKQRIYTDGEIAYCERRKTQHHLSRRGSPRKKPR